MVAQLGGSAGIRDVGGCFCDVVRARLVGDTAVSNIVQSLYMGTWQSQAECASLEVKIGLHQVGLHALTGVTADTYQTPLKPAGAVLAPAGRGE